MAAPIVIDLTNLTLEQGFIIQGDAAGDYAGLSVASAGDVNGDGHDDLIVGAPYSDNDGPDAGLAYVIYGGPTGSRTNIDLTNLTLAQGFIIQGDALYDSAGYSVSSAGDVNNDGYDDLIVGAPFGDNGGISAGEAYVIYGTSTASRTNIDLTSLTLARGFIIQGNASADQTGLSVSSAGDVNNDGIDDLIVGAPYGGNGGTDAGEAYVIYGVSTATRSNIDLANLQASQGFIIQGDAAGDYAGLSVSSAGDVNNDGYDDLIVGAPFGDNGGISAGEAYVIYGESTISRTNIDLTSLSLAQGFIIQGDAAGDMAGMNVSTAGDVNKDGYDDLIVGAPNGDNGGSSAGAAYVIFGGSTASRTNIDLTNLDPTQGFVIKGDAAGDQAGYCVSSGGDVNNDGYDDLIVNAPDSDIGGGNSGGAYVIYGGPTSSLTNIDLTNLTLAQGFIIQGDAADDRAGWSVSSAGDVNNDGYDDLIVGAPFGDNGGTNAGEAYVIYGSKNFGVPQVWTFSQESPTDLMLFAHFATDGYNGDKSAGVSSTGFRPPAGWTVLYATYDGGGGRPSTTSGEVFASTVVPGFQATAYREEATGRVVISYRGTDGTTSIGNLELPSELLNTSIPLGLGLMGTGASSWAYTVEYLQMAVDFYRAVIESGVSSDQIAFAGHSLGGIVAGYMSGITGLQGMIFDSGPTSEVYQYLDQFIDHSGAGFLTGAADFSKLVSDRVVDEVLGYAVDLAKEYAANQQRDALVDLFSSFVVGDAFGFTKAALVAALTTYAIERWGDAQIDSTPLAELDVGTSGLSAGDRHKMPLYQLLLYGDKVLGFTDQAYKDAAGFLESFYNSNLAQVAAQAAGLSGFAQINADTMFSDMVLAIGDDAVSGRENVLELLLSDAQYLLAPMSELAFGLGDSSFDTRIMPIISGYFVEMAGRALYSDQVDYRAALGMSTVGVNDEWLRLTPATLTSGVTWSQAFFDLRDEIADVMGLPSTDATQVIATADISILIDPDLGRTLVGSSRNDLMIGALDSLGQGVDMDGAGGQDVLIGTTGNDRLSGGSGTNILLGGMGNDIYIASSQVGSKTTISDLGGLDTLDLQGQGSIVGFVRGSGFAYLTDSLSLTIGTQGATVKMVNYYDSRLFDGDGFIERLIDGNGSLWRPTTMVEVAVGVVSHAVQSVKAGVTAFVTTSLDTIDRVVGTLESLGNRGVQIIGAAAEDAIDIGNSFLNFASFGLLGRDSGTESNRELAVPGQATDYILTIDADLDGIVDASINLIGSGAGMSLTVTTDSNGTTIGFQFDAASQFSIFGTDLGAEDLQGTAGADKIGGLGMNDRLYGLAGNDDLYGGLGDDLLNGGAGFDIMYGGKGNDIYVVDGLRDIVVEFANEGHDEVRSSVDFTLAPLVEVLVLTGRADIAGTGNALANTLKGNRGTNLLDGLGQNDTLRGSAGSDELRGGAGDDLLDGGSGNDTAVFESTGPITVDLAIVAAQNTGDGNDILRNLENVTSGGGNDSLLGNSSGNNLDGGDGNDALIGREGNDSLHGGSGTDILNGGLGDDLLVGGTDADTAVFQDGTIAARVDLSLTAAQNTGFGSDTLVDIENVASGSGNDSITGDAAGNVLASGAGSDRLFGGDGNDTLLGGAQDDFLVGGLGDDRLHGGSGNDTARFAGATAALVDLSILVAQNTGSGNDTFVSIENVVSGAGNDRLTGDAQANILTSGAGDDILNGGLGRDALTGGAGSDTFVFDTELGGENVDSIADFDVAFDVIHLDQGIFGGIALGALRGIAFWADPSGLAHDGSDRIIYETGTGNLFFDADGTGLTERVLFANVSVGLSLTNADFVVV